MSLVNVGNFTYPPFCRIGALQSLTLDAAEELTGWVLPIPKTGTLLKIGWGVAAASSFVGTLKVSLETVATGTASQPVATTDAGKTLYAAGAQSAAITSVSTGGRFDAINGSAPSTGISVTKGDMVSVVVRCTAYTSGSMAVAYDQFRAVVVGDQGQSGVAPYQFSYLSGTTWAAATGLPVLTLEYDTGIVPNVLCIPASGAAVETEAWNSSSNPDRRGLKMTFPFGCKLKGARFYMDTDQDTQVILYDTDEYTVMSGFPITLAANKRKGAAIGEQYVEFPTEPTLTASVAYRLVILPTTTTPNITASRHTPADDGAVLGMNAYVGGTNFVQTTFNGTPTSGSHAWTDTTTIRYGILPVISEIEFPEASGGGRPELRGANL